MLKNIERYFINIIIDWLITLFVVAVLMWVAFTLPTFPNGGTVENELEINQQSLKRHVETLVNDFSPRTIHYGNLNITAHYIHDQLSVYGNVRDQTYSTLAGRYKNILLELGPDTNEIFVIGAHYDAENNSIGVEGNASGVSTLIELARHLAKNAHQLSIKVQLVAYPLSQIKFTRPENMGSYHHAESLKQSNHQVKLMVSLDGVGNYSNESDSQKYPYQFMQLFYPEKGNYISLIGRLQDYSEVKAMKKSFGATSKLPLYSFNVPSNYTPTNSYDHLNYQSHGFPAVVLTDTADFRTREKGDVVDQLDYEKMAQLVRSLYNVVMASEATQPESVKLVQQKKRNQKPVRIQ